MKRADTSSDEVLDFWIDEVGPEGWYEVNDALDAAIRKRFEQLWHTARRGGWMDWTPTPRSALALVIVLDQFPRNMFRGEARAFATDQDAVRRAKCAIGKNWDLRVEGEARQFFYLPLMHSESLVDQDSCVRLFAQRMPAAEGNLLHARAHREVIRRFGRFPYRNAALGRPDTRAERDFLATEGYGDVVRSLQGEAAAAS